MKLKKISLIILLTTFFACKNNVGIEPTSTNLAGKWRFDKAFRNGTITNTLESGYFLFKDDKSIESNVFQVAEPKVYNVIDNKLEVNGVESFSLEFLKYSKDTMVLAGRMWYFDMEFHLVRDTIKLDSLSQ